MTTLPAALLHTSTVCAQARVEAAAASRRRAAMDEWIDNLLIRQAAVAPSQPIDNSYHCIACGCLIQITAKEAKSLQVYATQMCDCAKVQGFDGVYRTDSGKWLTPQGHAKECAIYVVLSYCHCCRDLHNTLCRTPQTAEYWATWERLEQRRRSFGY